MGIVETIEQTFISKQGLMRPFELKARIRTRQCSRRLESTLVDFGADGSFGEAAIKAKRHLGINIGPSTIREILYKHANNMIEVDKQLSNAHIPKNDAIEPAVIIVETDGSMVPLVEEQQKVLGQDRRKTRKTEWREMRLSVAFAKGSKTYKFAAGIDSADDTGRKLAVCAKLAGDKGRGKIHGVGDGATWIAEQIEKQFGARATYTIDFCHFASYLSEAAQCCAPNDTKSWFNAQKKRMKANGYNAVLAELRDHIDNCAKSDTCKAKKCFAYMDRRPSYFDYESTIASDLPIGSGAIESAHRSVIQRRLKLPGAYWNLRNANAMATLRTVRANRHEDLYWKNYAANVAIHH